MGAVTMTEHVVYGVLCGVVLGMCPAARYIRPAVIILKVYRHTNRRTARKRQKGKESAGRFCAACFFQRLAPVMQLPTRNKEQMPCKEGHRTEKKRTLKNKYNATEKATEKASLSGFVWREFVVVGCPRRQGSTEKRKHSTRGEMRPPVLPF